MPELTGIEVLDALKTLDPNVVVAAFRDAIQQEAIAAIANATEITITNQNGEVEAGHVVPHTVIRQGEIVLMDADGNTRTLTPTSDDSEPGIGFPPRK